MPKITRTSDILLAYENKGIDTSEFPSLRELGVKVPARFRSPEALKAFSAVLGKKLNERLKNAEESLERLTKEATLGFLGATNEEEAIAALEQKLSNKDEITYSDTDIKKLFSALIEKGYDTTYKQSQIEFLTLHAGLLRQELTNKHHVPMPKEKKEMILEAINTATLPTGARLMEDSYKNFEADTQKYFNELKAKAQQRLDTKQKSEVKAETKVEADAKHQDKPKVKSEVQRPKATTISAPVISPPQKKKRSSVGRIASLLQNANDTIRKAINRFDPLPESRKRSASLPSNTKTATEAPTIKPRAPSTPSPRKLTLTGKPIIGAGALAQHQNAEQAKRRSTSAPPLLQTSESSPDKKIKPSK